LTSRNPTCAQLRAAFSGAVRKGKAALATGHRQQVHAQSLRFQCSLDLDSHLAAREPNSARWDYILILANGRSRAVGVEVHHATASEVNTVLRKRNWATAELEQHAPTCMPARPDWYWVAAGKVFLRPTDPQFRVLQRSGMKGPMRQLVLTA
jgi:hypothetical protein